MEFSIQLSSHRLCAYSEGPTVARSQQKELPEVTIATAVPNFAFAALWVAEQLKFFEKRECARRSVWLAAALSAKLARLAVRSTVRLIRRLGSCALEGAPLIAIQAHNRNLTMSIGVRKEIADKLKVTRSSPLETRIKVLSQLGTIGATSPGAASEQVFKFLVAKGKGDPAKLKFAYLGGTELPAALMNNVVDGFALSPPSAEVTEAAGKGYVLIPLGKGEVPELTNYPFEVLMVRPDWAEQNSQLAMAVARAISKGGAIFHINPSKPKAALRAHRLFNRKKSRTMYLSCRTQWSRRQCQPGEI